jgi:hypothetical protein
MRLKRRRPPCCWQRVERFKRYLLLHHHQQLRCRSWQRAVLCMDRAWKMGSPGVAPSRVLDLWVWRCT